MKYVKEVTIDESSYPAKYGYKISIEHYDLDKLSLSSDDDVGML